FEHGIGNSPVISGNCTVHMPAANMFHIAMFFENGIKLITIDEFNSVLEKHGNVKHISCGHVHRTISGNHRGISYSVFKSTVGQMPMVFDKMDFHMETTTEPPAYGVIEIGDYGVTVHTEDYGLTDLDLYN
ncbi:MAG: hypothetical protein AAFX96_01770, partial [Pseudomonadota bacterium]